MDEDQHWDERNREEEERESNGLTWAVRHLSLYR